MNLKTLDVVVFACNVKASEVITSSIDIFHYIEYMYYVGSYISFIVVVVIVVVLIVSYHVEQHL